MPKYVIDIAHLIRTGNVVRKPEPTFAEFVVAATEYHKENDSKIFLSYFDALRVIRPDIIREMISDKSLKLGENESLTEMLAFAYKRW